MLIVWGRMKRLLDKWACAGDSRAHLVSLWGLRGCPLEKELAREGGDLHKNVLDLARGEGSLTPPRCFPPFPSCPVSQLGRGNESGKWPLQRG